jgi:hypothetical protein
MPDSNVTTTTEAPVLAEGEVACMACGHAVSAHDRISSRYCDATISHATTRRCICPGQKS